MTLDCKPIKALHQRGRPVAPRLLTVHTEAEQLVDARQEALDHEAQLTAILDTAVDAIITIDAQGLIESFNRAARRMFGYEPAEVIGRNVSMLMPEPYRSQHDNYMANYLRTGKARIIGIGREVVGRRKDGALFPIDLSVSEVKLGQRRTFTGIVRDISDRKRLEKEVLETSEREQRRIGQEPGKWAGSNIRKLRDQAGRNRACHRQFATRRGPGARRCGPAKSPEFFPIAQTGRRIRRRLYRARGLAL